MLAGRLLCEKAAPHVATGATFIQNRVGESQDALVMGIEIFGLEPVSVSGLNSNFVEENALAGGHKTCEDRSVDSGSCLFLRALDLVT